jgi:hypothetical protein
VNFIQAHFIQRLRAPHSAVLIYGLIILSHIKIVLASSQVCMQELREKYSDCDIKPNLCSNRLLT